MGAGEGRQCCPRVTSRNMVQIHSGWFRSPPFKLFAKVCGTKASLGQLPRTVPQTPDSAFWRMQAGTNVTSKF